MTKILVNTAGFGDSLALGDGFGDGEVCCALYGYGDGFGHGYGSGDGSGFGDGFRYGFGYGDGFGHGQYDGIGDGGLGD